MGSVGVRQSLTPAPRGQGGPGMSRRLSPLRALFTSRLAAAVTRPEPQDKSPKP